MVAKRLKIIIELLSSRPRTLQELRNLLQVPERTLRYNISILRKKGILRETFLLSDRRVKLLSLSENYKTNLTTNFETSKDFSLEAFNAPNR